MSMGNSRVPRRRAESSSRPLPMEDLSLLFRDRIGPRSLHLCPTRHGQKWRNVPLCFLRLKPGQIIPRSRPSRESLNRTANDHVLIEEHTFAGLGSFDTRLAPQVDDG